MECGSNLPTAGTELFGGLPTLGKISNALAKGLLNETQAGADLMASGMSSVFTKFSIRAKEYHYHIM